MASTFGRYLVRTALRVFEATSCFSRDTLSCLLLRNAMALQLSKLSICWAATGGMTVVNRRNINIFFICLV